MTMMNRSQDLFHLQTELIDSKVDMAANKAIDRVINEIHELRSDMDEQFSELGERITAVETRVTAVETTLTFIKDTQREIRSKFVEYTFKAGWLMLAGTISYVILHFFGVIR